MSFVSILLNLGDAPGEDIERARLDYLSGQGSDFLGGRVVIVEPYVNFFSYLIYKIFHNENTTWGYQFPSSGKISDKSASEGEQSLLQALLEQNIWVEYIQKLSQKKLKLKRFYFSPLSFFCYRWLV